MSSKRGQTAVGAAILLIVIMSLIVMFVLVINPTERAELLGEQTTASGKTGSSSTTPKVQIKETLVQKSPGRLTYLKDTKTEKLIPSVHIYTKTESKILAQESSLEIKNGAFSSQEGKVYFDVKDTKNTDNLLLDFSVDKFSGKLIIELNGKEIFNKETNKIIPITLPTNLMTSNNILTFKVSSPGIAFWKTNQYSLSKIKIAAKITDKSNQESKQLFNVDSDEAKNIKKVTLKLTPTCIEKDKGKLEVKINNYTIFSGIPENCKDLMYYTLPTQKIKAGNNWITFKTEKGDYKINQISIKIKLKSVSHPTYYFELDNDYFDLTSKNKAECGQIDGLCPTGCDADIDKDCCFQKYTTPYWCDTKTKNSGDRCVGSIDAADCSRCSSGYEDKLGNAPDECSGNCGDDQDGYCPSGCNEKYDKDCCFEKKGEQFWCKDLPTNGIDFTCMNSVSSGECSICPSGYGGEKTEPSCPVTTTKTKEEEKLKSDYQVILSLEFTDNQKKEAELYINGYKISFDTYKVEFTRDIKNYVEPWTNSIKIIPKSSFEIRNLKVEIKN